MGTVKVAKAAAPLPFWDDPAPSCPSSQLQQVPLQGTFPLPPTECSALPMCPSTSPGHSPRPANKVASSVRTDFCSHNLSDGKGPEAVGAGQTVEARLGSLGTMTLRVHVTSQNELRN